MEKIKETEKKKPPARLNQRADGELVNEFGQCPCCFPLS